MVLFDSLTNFIFTIYDLIWTSGEMLFSWFGTEVSSDVISLLDLPLGTTNLDLILGVFVPSMLMLSLFGFIINSIKPL